MGLHHATLKAAVLVYAALIGTMTEASLKAEIAKDEKGFTSQEVDEIYTAVLKSVEDSKTEKSYVKENDNQPASAEADRPEWVDALLKSNAETQASNQLVVDAVNQFKELAGELVKEIVEGAKASVEAAQINVPGPSTFEVQLSGYDKSAEYVVKVPFRDHKDFTKAYKVGEDVSNLGEERIKHLLLTGNVEEA
jgi:hypothetical protein